MKTIPLSETVDGSYIPPNLRHYLSGLLRTAPACSPYRPDSLLMRATFAGAVLATHGYHVALQAGSTDWVLRDREGYRVSLAHLAQPIFATRDEVVINNHNQYHVWLIVANTPLANHHVAELVDPSIRFVLDAFNCELKRQTGHCAKLEVPNLFCWSLGDNDRETFERVTEAHSALYIPCPHRTAVMHDHAARLADDLFANAGWMPTPHPHELWEPSDNRYSEDEAPKTIGESFWIQIPDGKLEAHGYASASSTTIQDPQAPPPKGGDQ